MNCPECDRPLTPEDHRGIELDVCGSCRGIWFDRGELEAYWVASNPGSEIPRVQGSDPVPGSGGTVLECPRCASDMAAARRVDVFLGTGCPACHGVWLTPAAEPRMPDSQMTISAGDRHFLNRALDVALDLVSLALGRR